LPLSGASRSFGIRGLLLQTQKNHDWMLAMALSFHAKHIASGLLVVGMLLAGFVPAAAQSGDGKCKTAEDALRSGVAAQRQNRHGAAVSYFSKAIDAGGLARKQLSFALYRRGISNRAQKQPAQAISDLNSALFFKGDLSERDRADAIEQRMGAYKDAGLKPSAVASAGSRPGRAAPAILSSSATSVKVTRARQSASTLSPTTPILGGNDAGRAAVAGTAGRPPAPFRTRVTANEKASGVVQSAGRSYAATKVDRGVGINSRQQATPRQRRAVAAENWQVATQSAPSGQPVVSSWSQPKVATTAAPPQAAPPKSNPPGQFFGGLFGGGNTTDNDKMPKTTGSVSPPVAPRATSAVRTAAVAPVPKAPGPASPPKAEVGGNFEIQVVVLRSRERADALAKQLMVQYSSSLSWTGTKSRVAERIGGEDGPLYAVRLGAYKNRGDLASLCDQLVNDGLDCLVVRQK
jgi:hypothetical protein